MRKNRTMRVAALLLALTLITSCFVGGTFAKYTSSTTGSDTATVAKWSFEVNDMEFAVQPEAALTFNLFDTVNEADTVTDEDNVTDAKIAPGTGGSFDLKVENLSEVDAKYTIELTETNNNGVYIQYSLDKAYWYDDFTAINANTTNMKDVALARENGTKTVTVYWRWCFEGTDAGAHAGQNDANDTLLGIYAQNAEAVPTVTVSATLTATQVN